MGYEDPPSNSFCYLALSCILGNHIIVMLSLKIEMKLLIVYFSGFLLSAFAFIKMFPIHLVSFNLSALKIHIQCGEQRQWTGKTYYWYNWTKNFPKWHLKNNKAFKLFFDNLILCWVLRFDTLCSSNQIRCQRMYLSDQSILHQSPAWSNEAHKVHRYLLNIYLFFAIV